MNKEQLQQQSELVIKPINEITGMDFKLFKVEINHYFFNDEEDFNWDDRIEFYFKFKTKSYIIHIKHYLNKIYTLSYKKNEGSKWNNNSFRTISELSDFIKQSKFNK